MLRGGLARLERALINFFVDMHTERHGYTEAFFIKGKQHNRPPQGSQASNPFSVDNWSSKQKCQEV